MQADLSVFYNDDLSVHYIFVSILNKNLYDMKWSTEIYTSKVRESKEFYSNYFNFEVKVEMEGFVVLQHSQNSAYELIFCIPNSPFVDPIFHPEFQGQGVLFQMEVADVEEVYYDLVKKGIEIRLDLVNEPVNGKHFAVLDPNGIAVDIVEFEK